MPPGYQKIGSTNDMVEKWAQLGFVVAKTAANRVEYVEDERTLKPTPPTA